MVNSFLFDIFQYPFDPNPKKFDPKLCQELYDWHLESWVQAESLGFDGVFFSEHHFTAYNLSPSPNLLVAALAQRTKRMRLGVMANIAPLHNPRRLAEESAMLDYLTNGRLELGFGRGVDEQEFLKEGIPMEENRARFEEALELMQLAWREPTFSYHGKYYDYEDVSLWPRPTRPELPLWITAISPSTQEWAARTGYKYTAAFKVASEIAADFKHYKEVARAAGRDPGPDDMGFLRIVFIADSDQEARDIAEPAVAHLFMLLKPAVIFHDLENVPAGYEFYQEFFRSFVGGDASFDDLINAGAVCVGSPSTVRDMVVSQVEEVGCNNFLMWSTWGTLTREQTVRSYELYARDVIPALRDLKV
jgi:alkanesulfonate monooxygenase SsuD/methylene tetrahydromethanopterin reductase-like flavin-dependent oxidoreductase (luciferase family)